MPRSLWKRVGDGPSAAVISGGGEGGRPLAWQGGYRAGVPRLVTGTLLARGGGAGRARVMQSLCSLPAPRRISGLRRPTGGCGGRLGGLGSGPHHGWVFLRVWGRSLSSGPLGTGAPACVGGQSSFGGALPCAL